MELDPTINDNLHHYIWNQLLKRIEKQTDWWVIWMDRNRQKSSFPNTVLMETNPCRCQHPTQGPKLIGQERLFRNLPLIEMNPCHCRDQCE